MGAGTLDGRVAVVTGGSRGLGKAIAKSIGSAGAKVALVSRDQNTFSAAAAEVRATGADVDVFQADVTDENEVRRVEHDVLSRFGYVDILVNNAGMNVRKPMLEFSLEEWNQVLATNLTGAFLMCRSFVPQMKGRGYGRIINLTSTMSHVSIPGRSACSASKAGLLGFTKALALELAAESITVVAISPGPFAGEIGDLARYLCSPAAGFVTGTDILIDGGWTAQ